MIILIIILSVGLPCLDDNNFILGMLNGHINQLEEIEINSFHNNLLNCRLPDIYERTKITLHFNEILEKEIIKLNKPNIKYLDITSFTYNSKLNRIKDEFYTGFDHHNDERLKYQSEIINKFLHHSDCRLKYHSEIINRFLSKSKL